MSWIGRKKIAFIPLYRPHAHPLDQIPADWANAILSRVLFDPDPLTGLDRSLRAYIHSVSSGRADLDAVVQPMVTLDREDVPPDFLEPQLGAQLRAQGFDAAAIVMLGGAGAGTSRGMWSRFVMAEGVGVWAMELMHTLTGFGDLYTAGGNLGAFDEMACSCATHPTAYTKAAIGWLDPAAIALHSSHAAVHYALHSVGLVQPPPAGRVAAVRIGTSVPYVMIEARQKVDLYDRGLPSQGVIVYRVQTADPLGHGQPDLPPVQLYTIPALAVGQAYTAPDSNARITVDAALPGGFQITVKLPISPACPGILADIQAIDELLAEHPGPPFAERKQMLAQRGHLLQQAVQLGCLPG